MLSRYNEAEQNNYVTYIFSPQNRKVSSFLYYPSICMTYEVSRLKTFWLIAAQENVDGLKDGPKKIYTINWQCANA